MIRSVRRSLPRRIAAGLLVLAAASMLASCDLGGSATNNNFQRVSNSIP
jgi:hypothetical protein